LEQTFGRYRLLDRLGEGGMAEVFKAKSFGVEGFEKVLVIKRILPRLAEQTRFVDLFVHEAKLAVRLSHANIVQVFDLGRVDAPDGGPTSFYIAMEYVPGLDLASMLARRRRTKAPVPIGLAVFVAAEVAKALDHAHRRRDEQARPLGIVHRDISPQNILVSWEGEVKVTDFGIAKARDSLDALDEGDEGALRLPGKLSYMSPEQAGAEGVDARSDLFSLGAVLYEMLAGHNPFRAPTAQETLRRVRAGEHPPLELARPDAPRPLAAIVARLLARAPGDRFPDAGRLHEELLGYFYASGERFGSNDLADFLGPLQDARGAPELEAGGLFDRELTGANERTPVEVPQATASARGMLGAADTGPLARVDAAQRREVTALVLILQEQGTSAPPSGAALRARDVLGRYGAALLDEEPPQIAAIFGLDDADGRDTEAAVRAALVILRARSATTSVSAGVAVGRVLVGADGRVVRDEHFASLVSSAQALARATDGRVAVSLLAGRIIRSAFATEELPGAGRTAPEGGRVVSTVRPPASVLGRFVGRHDELRRLGEILAKATRKRAQIVTVVGPKGIGKTRLLSEMERRLDKGRYNVGFYLASCPKNGEGAPWSGLTAMLQVLCGVQEGDDEARILDVLPRLRALGLHDDEASAVLGQLGASLGPAPASRSPSSLVSASLKSAFARMVQSLCDDQLHCFAWDDAHAMDPATLEAIVSTASRTGAALRACFLLATREVTPRAAAAADHPQHHLLPVGELSDEASALLLATRVGARVVPPELLAFCRERAGGHPLFLEELIKELTDSGAISVLTGTVKARLEGANAVPRSLRALIAARVARLEPEDRAVLQAAAILGDPVPTEVLAALLGQNVAQVDRAIAGLAARDLLRATGPATASFASPMHGEIVLDAIPADAQRELSAAAAAAYLAVVGEQGAEHQGRVAQHLYLAGDRDRAATFFARAALERARVHQLELAIRLLSRALELADLERRDAGEIAAWLSALADAVARARSAPELPELLSRALARIDASGSLEARARARVDAARALGSVNRFDEAYAHLEEAYALAGDEGAPRRAGLVVEIEMSARSGDFLRGVRAADRLEATGPIEDARVLPLVAHVRAAAGEGEAAVRAIDRAEAASDPSDLAAAVEREKQRVLLFLYLRDPARAVAASARAVDLARSTGLRFELAAILHNLGDACRQTGDRPRAYAIFSESLDLAEDAGHERLAALNRIHLAYLDGLSGAAEAPGLLRDYARHVESRGYVTDALEARYLLGKLHQERGERDAARRELEGVLAKASEYGNGMIAAYARETLAAL
jgi:serine/threonine protein kinase/tetratricopeptide (TPR) repeat protein